VLLITSNLVFIVIIFRNYSALVIVARLLS